MRRIGRPSPLYLAAAILAIGAVVFSFATVGGDEQGSDRTGSVYDEGPGGAAALRRYLEAMGAKTSTVQGDSFVLERSNAGVLFVLGASELFSGPDAQTLAAFVRAGGTAIVATDLGLFERPLLDALGVRTAGILAPGSHPLTNAAFADPPARAIAFDRGVTFAPGPSLLTLATDGRAPAVVAKRDGAGLVYVVGSLGPFLTAGLGEADNGRFALDLAGGALAAGREIVFDEYHHGVHPTTDVLVLLERTWPGRALVFALVATFLYLVLSGRRLGPPVPLDPRPPRSSLEFVRGFAGLVRRSGHGEIARRRLRHDLRRGLARAVALDADTPFDRVLTTVAASDRERAAEARAVDDALGHRLREDQLLRTVRQIERLVGQR